MCVCVCVCVRGRDAACFDFCVITSSTHSPSLLPISFISFIRHSLPSTHHLIHTSPIPSHPIPSPHPLIPSPHPVPSLPPSLFPPSLFPPSLCSHCVRLKVLQTRHQHRTLHHRHSHDRRRLLRGDARVDGTCGVWIHHIRYPFIHPLYTLYCHICTYIYPLYMYIHHIYTSKHL